MQPSSSIEDTLGFAHAVWQLIQKLSAHGEAIAPPWRADRPQGQQRGLAAYATARGCIEVAFQVRQTHFHIGRQRHTHNISSWLIRHSALRLCARLVRLFLRGTVLPVWIGNTL